MTILRRVFSFKVGDFQACTFKWTRQRFKPPTYHHMICIGKTKLTSQLMWHHSFFCNCFICFSLFTMVSSLLGLTLETSPLLSWWFLFLVLVFPMRFFSSLNSNSSWVVETIYRTVAMARSACNKRNRLLETLGAYHLHHPSGWKCSVLQLVETQIETIKEMYWKVQKKKKKCID